MKKTTIGLISSYLCTAILLTLTMFTNEVIQDVYMAALIGLIFISFTLIWCKLVPLTKIAPLHKSLFVLMTWHVLLTSGDIFFFKDVPNLLIKTSILVSLLACVYVFRKNKLIVDACTAAILLVTLYIAMHIEHKIIPGGLLGGICISLLFLIVAALNSLQVTHVIARIVFFLTAIAILIFIPVTPVIADGGYLLYVLLIIFIVAFVFRRKIELILPHKAMPILIAVALIIYVIKVVLN